MAGGVAWQPIVARLGDSELTIRQAITEDIPMLQHWDIDPDVIACSSDDADAEVAFGGIYWADELAAQSDVSRYFIAELDGRPIGALQVIDPALEPTHYWGEIEQGLRAIDIWLGSAADRNRGLGTAIMRAVVDRCFEASEVTAIVIDPLASNANAHRFYQRLGFTPVGRRLFGDDDCLVHRLERAAWENAQGRKGT